MVYIVKNGVVDITFGKERPVLETKAGQRGFDPEKIRSSEIHSNVILPKKIETPELKINTEVKNFKVNTSKTVNQLKTSSHLYTASNLIDNNQKNVAKDRLVSIYLKKNKYLENQTLNLKNNGVYDTKRSAFQNLGNFEESLVVPIRKIDTDKNGIKFQNSVGGYKNIESRELFTPQVPIRRDPTYNKNPIYSISNGTKTVNKIKH